MSLIVDITQFEKYGFGEIPELTLCAKKDFLRQKANGLALFILLGILLIAIPGALGYGVGAVTNIRSDSIKALGALTGAGVGMLGIAACLIFIFVFRYKPTPSTKVHPRSGVGDVTENNQVYVTNDAKETSDIRKSLIGTAKDTIKISGNFCGGKVFQEHLDAVKERLQSNPLLIAKLLCSHDLLRSADLTYLENLKKDFPQQFFYLITHTKIDPRTGGSVENHVKLTVVDDECMVAGGTGIEPSFCTVGIEKAQRTSDHIWKNDLAGLAARDMDTVCWGQAAKIASGQFDKLWKRWQENMSLPQSSIAPPMLVMPEDPQGEPSDRLQLPFIKSNVRVLVSDPDKPNAITARFVKEIQEAQPGETITLGSIVFNPSKPIRKALQKAVRRGVNVTMITSGIFKDGPKGNKLIAKANDARYLPLMAGKKVRWFHRLSKLRPSPQHGKVQIFEYQVPQTQYHKKIMTIENRVAMIGSYNLTTKSDQADYEMQLVIGNPAAVQKINDVLQSDINLCRQVSLAEARDRYRSLIGWWAGRWQNIYY